MTTPYSFTIINDCAGRKEESLWGMITVDGIPQILDFWDFAEILHEQKIVTFGSKT